MFVYMVTGTKEQTESFKTAQGDYYREDDDKHPLWFSNKFVGLTGKLIITSKDKVVPDTSQYDQAASIANQYGGNFGQALANAFAQSIIGSAPAPVANPTAVDESIDLE